MIISVCSPRKPDLLEVVSRTARIQKGRASRTSLAFLRSTSAHFASYMAPRINYWTPNEIAQLKVLWGLLHNWKLVSEHLKTDYVPCRSRSACANKCKRAGGEFERSGS